VVILSAAVIGLVRSLASTPENPLEPTAPDGTGRVDVAATGASRHLRPSLSRAIRVLAIGLSLWLAPTLLLVLALGGDHVFSQVATFFSTMAVVTFGGAYAVLSYVAQAGVERYGWLEPGEMLDGLGMAETTPGPLIQVVQFVGFLAAFRAPGTLDPYHAALIASVLTTWVTFVPCFVWIFLGAPYVESLRHNRWAQGALSSITAAVVGVILNLALWFGLHVLFADMDRLAIAGGAIPLPVWRSIDVPAASLTAGAFVCLFGFRLGMLKTLAAATAAGALVHAFLRS
jgi:chromate transporter